MTDTPDELAPIDPDRIETDVRTHETTDGVTLSTIVFRPDSVTPAAPAPVLLERTPYGRPADLDAVSPFARVAMACGYTLAYEDTRGRGQSDGRFLPWVDEAADGATTIEWLADFDWCTQVGMVGGSSPGQVQLLVAAERPDGLGAVAPWFAPADLHRSDFFQDGAMSALTLFTWSLESLARHTVDRLERRGRLDAETASACHEAIASALEDLDALVSHRPLVDLPQVVFADVDLPEDLTPDDLVPHWEPWTSRPTYDEFWESFDPERSYDRIDVPGLHLTGWYDLCQDGTVTNYTGLREHSPAPQHLVVGPWSHQNAGRRIGAVDFGSTASTDAYGSGRLLLAFFDTYLRETPTAPFTDPEESVVETFRATVSSETVGDGSETHDDLRQQERDDPAGEHTKIEEPVAVGSGQWRVHDDWPPTDATRETWYLSSEGAAATDLSDGRLTRTPPSTGEPADRFTHDPLDPVPTRGGPLCCGEASLPAGPFDRADVQRRDDVATYTTDPLDEPLELAGPVSVTAVAATTAPDTDFTAHLTHLTDDGRAFPLCEGIRRVQYREGRGRSVPARPGESVTVGIDCWNVNWLVPRGDRLRLEVASSNAPRFDPHPGTLDPWQATSEEVQTAEQTLFHDPDRESTLTVYRR